MTTIVIDDDPKYQRPQKPTLKNVKVRIQSKELKFRLEYVSKSNLRARMLRNFYEAVKGDERIKKSLSDSDYQYLVKDTLDTWNEQSDHYLQSNTRALAYLARTLMDYLDITVDGTDISVDILK